MFVSRSRPLFIVIVGLIPFITLAREIFQLGTGLTVPNAGLVDMIPCKQVGRLFIA